MTEVARAPSRSSQSSGLAIVSTLNARLYRVIYATLTLTNSAMDSETRLCILLVGHPELRRRLNMAALDAHAQRIVVRARTRGPTARRRRRTPSTTSGSSAGTTLS